MSELVPKHYTYDALKQALFRHKHLPYGPKRAMSGGNGRELLVFLNSLPTKVKETFQQPTREWTPPKYN